MERVKLDFKKRYGGGKADTAVAKSLSKEFGYVHPMQFPLICYLTVFSKRFFHKKPYTLQVLIYRPIMKEHMKYIIDHADEIGKLLKVKAQVSEVKSIMLENIDKV